jgi:hypothetical protein
VAVLHVEGRMSDDDHYDDFVDWSEGLAEDARGAIYQPMGTRQFCTLCRHGIETSFCNR